MTSRSSAGPRCFPYWSYKSQDRYSETLTSPSLSQVRPAVVKTYSRTRSVGTGTDIFPHGSRASQSAPVLSCSPAEAPCPDRRHHPSARMAAASGWFLQSVAQTSLRTARLPQPTFSRLSRAAAASPSTLRSRDLLPARLRPPITHGHGHALCIVPTTTSPLIRSWVLHLASHSDSWLIQKPKGSRGSHPSLGRRGRLPRALRPQGAESMHSAEACSE